jgi:heptosyltransferase-2
VGFGSASGAFLFDEKAPYPAGMHESLRMLDLAPSDLVPDNVRATLAAHGAPLLRPEGPPRALFAAHPRLVAPGSRYFVVSPGSVWATKQYPAEAFADAARLLLEGDPHLLCVLSGGPSDAAATNAFLTAAAAWPEEHRARLVDAIDCIPLEDLPAVLALASVSLANDSAPLHVACGVGTPVVGVYGPTSTDTGYGPSGTRARAVNYATEHGAALACQPCSKHGHGQCPLGHFRCMRLLPATTVARVAREVAQPFEEVIHSESAAPR